MLHVREGDTVTLRLLRDGEKITVTMTITEDCIVAY